MEIETRDDSGEDLSELSVRCLMLTLHGGRLLLPNTMVAEVSDMLGVSLASHGPNWLRGFVSWRGRSVPLISFENLLGIQTIGRGDEGRLVILNTIRGNPRVPFIALEIQGLPHLTLVNNEMLSYDEEFSKNEPMVLAYLRLQGEAVIVPNIDRVEQMLEGLGING